MKTTYKSIKMWKEVKSKIHGTGIIATEEIKIGTQIIQYIGEKITKKKVTKGLPKESKSFLIKRMKVLCIYLN